MGAGQRYYISLRDIAAAMIHATAAVRACAVVVRIRRDASPGRRLTFAMSITLDTPH